MPHALQLFVVYFSCDLFLVYQYFFSLVLMDWVFLFRALLAATSHFFLLTANLLSHLFRFPFSIVLSCTSNSLFFSFGHAMWSSSVITDWMNCYYAFINILLWKMYPTECYSIFHISVIHDFSNSPPIIQKKKKTIMRKSDVVCWWVRWIQQSSLRGIELKLLFIQR